MATRTGSVVGGNWGDTTAWVEAAVPTAADDVVLNSLSGNITINSGATRFCRSLDCTGYVGTLTHNTSTTLSIGDGTTGHFKFSSGMTYSGFNQANSILNFVSTTTGNQITTAGKTMTSTTFNGVGGAWAFQDNYFIGTGSNLVLTLTNGSLDANGKNVNIGRLECSNSNTRTLTLGGGTWTIGGASATSWNIATATGLTLSGASATIALTYNGSSNTIFAGGGKTYGTIIITTGGTGTRTFSGSNTFTKLTATGGSTKTILFTAGTTQTLSGGTDSFFSGTSGNLITCKSLTDGSAWNLSKSSGSVDCSYLSLQDSAAAGGATFNATNSTDVSGNSGWNITPPAGQPMSKRMGGVQFAHGGHQYGSGIRRW